MSNPRHAFILIGFLAQALTWDSMGVILLAVALWILAVTVLQNRIRISVTAEGFIMLLGCILSIVVSRMLGRTAHFFLGDGLILLQMVRMTRPLAKREKLISLIIACFHFGVVCTLAPNIRFVLLFVASIYLFPRALKEVLLSEDEAPLPKSKTARPILYPRKFSLPRRVYAGLLAMSIFAFLGLPRFSGTPLQLRDTAANQASLLDSILDPRSGGQANSQEVLMQIEGDYIGYLRCFALSVLEGDRWSVAPTRSRALPQQTKAEDLKRALHRKVFIKNPYYLGLILPVDGQVLKLNGNFFNYPSITEQGAITTSRILSTVNNTYEYWIRPRNVPEPLDPALRPQLLYHPPQSERLEQWVAERTAAAKTPLEKARLLESYLRTKFTYRIGTPELSRMSPVDDFVFNRREGHCERFAAALALMLRMEGIPSRVVIGYLATERNIFSGRLQVRFRDAHSWTEAWIEGEGWVTLDATPGGNASGISADLTNLLEALDFAWYAHVVNFNGFREGEIFGQAVRLTARVPEEIWGHAVWGLLAALTGLCVVRFRDRLKLGPFLTRPTSGTAFAQHSYGRMLALFHRAGVTRPAHETPLEFLERLRRNGSRGYTEAAVITHLFCRQTYAGQALSPADQANAESALRSLKLILRQKPEMDRPPLKPSAASPSSSR